MNGDFGWQVNLALTVYRSLFDMMDMLLYLNAPSMEHVYRWRLRQERQLRMRTGSGLDDASVRHLVDAFMLITLQLKQAIIAMQCVCPAGAILQLGDDQIPRWYRFFGKFSN